MDDKGGAPHQKYRWLRPFIPKRLQPYLRGLRKRLHRIATRLDEPFHTAFPYTQVSQTKQRNLLRLCRALDERHIEGAIVECGVLDGGTAAIMAYGTRDSSRQVHLFDAWEGLPEATGQDGPSAKKWVGEVVGSPRRVIDVMSKLKVPRDRIHLHRGWFEEVFPHVQIEKIALLHIDCDFYEPTALCLRRWYPHLSSGGYVQFDDYLAFAGCTKAVDEFLSDKGVQLQRWGQAGEAHFIEKPREV